MKFQGGLVFLGNPPGGGAEQATLRMVSRLLHEPEVVWLGMPSQGIGLATKLAQAMLSLRGRARDCERAGATLVVVTTHSKLSVLVGLLFRLRFFPKETRLVVRESTRIFARLTGLNWLLRRLLYRTCLPGATMIVCQTIQMADEVREVLARRHGSKVIVVENSVDSERVQQLAAEPFARPTQRPYLIAVGRLIPEKAFDVLVRAYACSVVRASHDLVICGDGPHMADLREFVERSGLGGNVLLLGKVGNPFPLMSSASLGVVSSLVEGFPNVVLEFSVLGVPLVLTNCFDGFERYSDFYCRAGDAQGLAREIDRALVAPSVRGADSVLQRHSLAVVSRRFAEEFLSRVGPP